MNIKATRGVLIGAAASLALVGTMASSCQNSKAFQQYNDAPTTGRNNSQPMEVIEGADGFTNAGTKCDGHGGRVFLSFHGNGSYASISDIPYAQLKASDPCRTQG